MHPYPGSRNAVGQASGRRLPALPTADSYHPPTWRRRFAAAGHRRRPAQPERFPAFHRQHAAMGRPVWSESSCAGRDQGLGPNFRGGGVVLDQQERCSERRSALLEERPSDGAPAPSSVASSLHPKPGLSRPQHLLELACRIVGASQGGIGLLSSDGELVEHLTYGLSYEVASQLWHSPRTAQLIPIVLHQPMPTNIKDFGQ